MNKFGQVKIKFFSKVVDSYLTDKKDITRLMNIIKEDKNFKELYLLYEKVENQYFTDKETARYYVDELSQSLEGRNKLVSKTLKKLDKAIGLVETKYLSLYDNLDVLMEEDNLLNIETKVAAKKELVEHLTKKKELKENNQTAVFSENEKLLYSVLANNFNALYENTLSENEKQEFQKIMSMSENDIKTKTEELKENILNQIDKLLSESKDSDLNDKLDKVKQEVTNTEHSRYNYYKLMELQSGL